MEEFSLLILDEPFESIDREGVIRPRGLLKSLNEEKGVTILISSHVGEDIRQLCKSV